MKFDPQKHHRKSIRLKGYDYSQAGAYFVTIVTYQRDCLFGEIVNGELMLNEYGKIVQKWWDEIPIHFPNVELGAFVIMPNHIHGIIFVITERRGEVISPRYNPNFNNQNINVDETNQLGGETPPLRKPNYNNQNINMDETNQQGRGDRAPTQTNAGTNCCVFQISIYKRDE